jgi:hypothetical protein
MLRSLLSGLLKHLSEAMGPEDDLNELETIKEILASDKENEPFGNIFPYNRQILVSSTLNISLSFFGQCRSFYNRVLRAVVHYLFKVMCVYFCSALPRSFIDSKNSRDYLSQLKPRLFPRLGPVTFICFQL